jgi:uncharacterized iron-regulated membrane protein
MSNAVISAGRRFRMGATLVALALALGVLVLATQARSIWSARTGPEARPTQIAPGVDSGPSEARHLPDGCRVKFGC